jgi:hypothetical protein
MLHFILVLKIYHFQVDARALGEVEYVDVMQGSSEAFLRCSTPTAAELLVSNAPWQQVDILKGKHCVMLKNYLGTGGEHQTHLLSD